MQPTILLVRHSNTTWDDKVDALMDPPLDEQGVERLKRTRDFLANNGFLFQRILSSPLQRTVRTAGIVTDKKPITTHNACLPWNLGDLMGKRTADVEGQIEELEQLLDTPAPHGESYRSFYNRWTGFLGKVMRYVEAKPEEPILIVTHSRNINALQEFIDGAPLGDVKETTPEASVTLLQHNGAWTQHRIWEGN